MRLNRRAFFDRPKTTTRVCGALEAATSSWKGLRADTGKRASRHGCCISVRIASGGAVRAGWSRPRTPQGVPIGHRRTVHLVQRQLKKVGECKRIQLRRGGRAPVGLCWRSFRRSVHPPSDTEPGRLRVRAPALKSSCEPSTPTAAHIQIQTVSIAVIRLCESQAKGTGWRMNAFGGCSNGPLIGGMSLASGPYGLAAHPGRPTPLFCRFAPMLLITTRRLCLVRDLEPGRQGKKKWEQHLGRGRACWPCLALSCSPHSRSA